MTVWLHADEAGMGLDQRFLLKLSVTREAARVLALDGMAVSDGRPKGALAKKDPMPYGVPVVSKIGGLRSHLYFRICKRQCFDFVMFDFRKNRLAQSCPLEVREEELLEVQVK